VLIEGTIIDGDSRTIPFLGIQFTGGDTIVKQLRALRADPMCKGIILRVNSPGGSALASDVIWREVARTHEAFARNPKKSPPIVVSMGDVAASGGYYVAMGARTIFASSMTLTGSIGVVSLHFDLSGLLAKLGISTTTFQRGKNADIASVYKPYTDDQRARMDASMRRVYDLFRGRVAEGRDMTIDEVDKLGRGHVYSGTDAHALKLVDQLGGCTRPSSPCAARPACPRAATSICACSPASAASSTSSSSRSSRSPTRACAPASPTAARPASSSRSRSTPPSRAPARPPVPPADQALALLPGLVEVE
jgi:protease-4